MKRKAEVVQRLLTIAGSAICCAGPALIELVLIQIPAKCLGDAIELAAGHSADNRMEHWHKPTLTRQKSNRALILLLGF